MRSPRSQLRESDEDQADTHQTVGPLQRLIEGVDQQADADELTHKSAD